MNIFRNILISLASLIVITAVTGFAYVLTIHTTIMDRGVVKSWLSESKVYDGRLINALVSTGNPDNSTPQSTANALLNTSPEVIKSALNATFTPEYTQSQIEGVVNNAYDWIDGSSPEFKFSIPIDQKRDTFITQLAKAIEPQIAALPVCQALTTAQAAICRPPNITVEQLSKELSTRSIDESGSFTKPINNESVTKADAQASKQPSLSQLPEVRNMIDLLLWVLPVVAILSLAAIIFITKRGGRITRTAQLSRRISLSMLFIFIPTAIVLWLAKDNDFGLSGMFTPQMGQLTVPLIKTIIVGILSQFGLITGTIAALGIIAWIILSILVRNKPQLVASTLSPVSTTQQPASTDQFARQASLIVTEPTPQPSVDRPQQSDITASKALHQQPMVSQRSSYDRR